MEVVKILKALAEGTRVRIINLLIDSDLCVCDLVDVLELPQPTVSRHLKYLKDINLIEGYKQGFFSMYHLNKDEIYNSFLLPAISNGYFNNDILNSDRKKLEKRMKNRSGYDEYTSSNE